MKDTKETLPALTPAMMLEKAITTGANVDVLEKLLALQERWEATQARKAFEQALADLRADLPDIVKTKQANMGPGRPTYRYEDLSEMVDALSPVLSRHGLSFRWRTESSRPDAVTVTCLLAHRDGHSEQTSLTASHDHSGAKNPVQALGSTVTYLQRYTLKASLGIAASTDDDAQAVASSATPPPPVAKPKASTKQEPNYAISTPTDMEWVIGVLEKLSIKEGTKKDGSIFVRYGALILGEWYGTFNSALGQQLAELEGRHVRLAWRPEGKFRTAVAVESYSETADLDAEAVSLPPELDDPRLL